MLNNSTLCYRAGNYETPALKLMELTFDSSYLTASLGSDISDWTTDPEEITL